MRRIQKAGDIDIVPAGVSGSWEDDAECRILSLSFEPGLVQRAAEELGRDMRKSELQPRMQLRDVRIEAIGSAVKADLEADSPSDVLYVEHLANALAVRLVEIATGVVASPGRGGDRRLSSRQMRVLIEFIETNLDQKLHLADLAAVVGMNVTRLKATFRTSTGVPVHQYVIRRRVEYARALLATTAMPASQVALAAGFSHQSHMASTMRRLLGQTPRDIVRQTSESGPNLQNHA